MASLQKNVSGQNFTFCLVNATTGAALTGATVSVFVTKDNAAQASGGGTVTGSGNGQYNYAPTQAETNATDVGFLMTATSAIPVNLDFHTDVVDGNGLLQVDLVDIAGSAVSTSTAQLGVNAVDVGGTAQTARDLGASVLLSSGTGTGQLNISGGNLAGSVGSVTGAVGSVTGNVGGNVTGSVGSVVATVAANLTQILGTALTETAGQIAAAFKQWFNVATPAGTVNSLPNATPGASGGVFIAGSNAATTVNIAGSLSGSVGSVTGAVGSVTGAAGSVTGAVGSVTGNVGGNVAGSVASVTATVAANVTEINGNATAAANVSLANQAIGRGTCAAGGSTTSIPTSAFAPGGSGIVSGQFIGRTIIFDAGTATASLQGQATSITANTAAADPTFTVTALTTAPSSGDTFGVY